MPKFEPGSPRPVNSGRRRGVRNKVPTSVKEALLEAARLKGNDRPHPVTGKRTHKGMIAYFRSLPDDLFCKLLAHIIPREIEADLTADIVARPGQPLDTMSAEQLEQVIAASERRFLTNGR
jgi:hypothetical protein